jgi:hypothetical protein
VAQGIGPEFKLQYCQKKKKKNKKRKGLTVMECNIFKETQEIQHASTWGREGQGSSHVP